ncbi:MAG: glycosyltransferase, partial [Oscillospiraceae bacterium]|nr:glycosyltransferase [Oscillospiraceae bacterium]
MPKIKVLHLSMTKSIGGIASFQKNLFDNIDKTSFAFEFVSTYPNAALAEYFENAGAVVHKLPPQKTVLPYCTALFKLLKKQKYNIVHIHKNSCANPLAFLVCALAGVKIVCHSHNTKAVGGKAADLAHYIFRPFVKRASAVWAACSAEAGVWLYGKKAVKSGKVVVVKNGINLPSFAYNTAVRNKARAQLNLQNALIIGHVGNYIPQKNHKFIIDIFAQIAKSKPNSALLLVGRG